MTITARIGDVADTVRGVTYDKQDVRSSSSADYLPLLRATNIVSGRLNFDDVIYVPSNVVSEEQILRPGDIVLASSSGSLAVVGKAAPLLAQWTGTFGAFCAVVRPQVGMNALYLSHFMQTSSYRERISTLAAGVNINNLRREHIASIEFPFVSAGSQQRIVEAIDSYLSRLDAAAASLARVQAKLKAYRASVLKAAVEGRLVPTEAALAKQEQRDYEPASVLLDRILGERRRLWEEAELARLTKAGKPPKDDKWKAKYEQPAAPDPSKLPPLPEGWCWATVEQLSSTIFYGTSAKTSSDGEIPVLRMGNIIDGRLDLTELKYLPSTHEEFPSLLLREGDLLFNRTNSAELVGKTAVYQGSPPVVSFASYLICVRSLCQSRWISHVINSPYGRFWISDVVVQQVGQANVNGTKLRSLAVPLPPNQEQDRLLNQIDLLLSTAENSLRITAHELMRISRLRQAVLKWAFEGKLVDQDPRDEPADVLLARIAAERAAAPSPKTRGRRAKSV